MLGDIVGRDVHLRVRAGLLVVVGGAPLVADHLHARVEGERDLKDVLPEQLVDRSSGDGVHAAFALVVVGKVAVGIQAVLGPPVLRIAQRIGHGHDVDRPRAQQPIQPRQLRIRKVVFREALAALSLSARLCASRSIHQQLRSLQRGHRPDALVAVESAAHERFGELGRLCIFGVPAEAQNELLAWLSVAGPRRRQAVALLSGIELCEVREIGGETA
eukprot:scaffold869_cov303-Pinguiococcus_pyrenoidosus.AAC.19